MRRMFTATLVAVAVAVAAAAPGRSGNDKKVIAAAAAAAAAGTNMQQPSGSHGAGQREGRVLAAKKSSPISSMGMTALNVAAKAAGLQMLYDTVDEVGDAMEELDYASILEKMGGVWGLANDAASHLKDGLLPFVELSDEDQAAVLEAVESTRDLLLEKLTFLLECLGGDALDAEAEMMTGQSAADGLGAFIHTELAKVRTVRRKARPQSGYDTPALNNIRGYKVSATVVLGYDVFKAFDQLRTKYYSQRNKTPQPTATPRKWKLTPKIAFKVRTTLGDIWDQKEATILLGVAGTVGYDFHDYTPATPQPTTPAPPTNAPPTPAPPTNAPPTPAPPTNAPPTPAPPTNAPPTPAPPTNAPPTPAPPTNAPPTPAPPTNAPPTPAPPTNAPPTPAPPTNAPPTPAPPTNAPPTPAPPTNAPPTPAPPTNAPPTPAPPTNAPPTPAPPTNAPPTPAPPTSVPTSSEGEDGERREAEVESVSGALSGFLKLIVFSFDAGMPATCTPDCIGVTVGLGPISTLVPDVHAAVALPNPLNILDLSWDFWQTLQVGFKMNFYEVLRLGWSGLKALWKAGRDLVSNQVEEAAQVAGTTVAPAANRLQVLQFTAAKAWKLSGESDSGTIFYKREAVAQSSAEDTLEAVVEGLKPVVKFLTGTYEADFCLGTTCDDPGAANKDVLEITGNASLTFPECRSVKAQFNSPRITAAALANMAADAMPDSWSGPRDFVQNTVVPQLGFGLQDVVITAELGLGGDLEVKASGNPDLSSIPESNLVLQAVKDLAETPLLLVEALGSPGTGSLTLSAGVGLAGDTSQSNVALIDSVGGGVRFMMTNELAVVLSEVRYTAYFPVRFCVEGCTMLAYEERRFLNMSGKIALRTNMLGTFVTGTVDMQGTWYNMLGLPFAHAYRLLAGLTIQLGSGLPVGFQIGGEVCLGTQEECDNDDEAAITAVVYLGLDASQPDDNYFVAMVEQLSVADVLRLVGLADTAVYNQLPGCLLDSGIFPRNPELCTQQAGMVANVTDMTTVDVNCYAYLMMSLYSRSIQTQAGTLEVPTGISGSGRLNLLGWDILMSLEVSPTRLYVDVESEPLDVVIGGVSAVKLTGSDGRSGPRFFVDADVTNGVEVFIDAALEVPPIGCSGKGRITFNATDGLRATADVTLFWGMATASATLEWTPTRLYAMVHEASFVGGVVRLVDTGYEHSVTSGEVRVQGTVKLLGWGLSAVAVVTPTSVSVSAEADTLDLKVGPVSVFKLTGNSGSGGPSFAISVGQNTAPSGSIDCAVEVPLIGASVGTTIAFAGEHFSFSGTLSLFWGLFSAQGVSAAWKADLSYVEINIPHFGFGSILAFDNVLYRHDLNTPSGATASLSGTLTVLGISLSASVEVSSSQLAVSVWMDPVHLRIAGTTVLSLTESLSVTNKGPYLDVTVPLSGGSSGSAKRSAEAAAVELASTASVNTSGLHLVVYENYLPHKKFTATPTSFDGLRVVMRSSTATVDFTTRSWEKLGLWSQFATRHFGYLETERGDYTLYVTSGVAGRVSLWVDGMAWTSGETRELLEGYHEINIHFYQTTGVSDLKLEWTAPGGSREVVPAERLHTSVNGLKLHIYKYPLLFSLPSFHPQLRIMKTVTSFIDYTSTKWKIHHSSLTNHFAVRAFGYLLAETAGEYTLFLASDDGSRLLLRGEKLIDNDGVHGTIEKSVTVQLSAGYHPIEIEYFQSTSGNRFRFRWTTPTLGKRTVPESAFAMSAPGLHTEAYRPGGNMYDFPAYDKLTPKETFVLPYLDYGWSPLKDMGYTDHFAMRFTGYLVVPKTTMYTLIIGSDDGSRLYLEGSLLVNNGGRHGYLEKSATVFLAAGHHPIEIHYFQGGGGRQVRFKWQVDGGAKEAVPEANLRTPTSAGSFAAAPPPAAVRYHHGASAGLHMFVYRRSGTAQMTDFPTYTNLEAFRREVVAELDFSLNDWSSQEGGSTHFAVRLVGYLYCPTAGSYGFWLTSDDGSRMYIDGSQRINNGGTHGSRTKSKTVALEAGYREIEIQYFQKGGGATLVFEWKPPGGSRGPVPLGNLRTLPGPVSSVVVDTGSVSGSGSGSGSGSMEVTTEDAGSNMLQLEMSAAVDIPLLGTEGSMLITTEGDVYKASASLKLLWGVAKAQVDVEWTPSMSYLRVAIAEVSLLGGFVKFTDVLYMHEHTSSSSVMELAGTLTVAQIVGLSTSMTVVRSGSSVSGNFEATAAVLGVGQVTASGSVTTTGSLTAADWSVSVSVSVDWGAIVAFAEDAWEGVKSVANTVKNKVVQLGESIGSLASKITQAVGDWAVGAVSTMSNAFNDLGNSVANFFTNALKSIESLFVNKVTRNKGWHFVNQYTDYQCQLREYRWQECKRICVIHCWIEDCKWKKSDKLRPTEICYRAAAQTAHLAQIDMTEKSSLEAEQQAEEEGNPGLKAVWEDRVSMPAVEDAAYTVSIGATSTTLKQKWPKMSATNTNSPLQSASNANVGGLAVDEDANLVNPGTAITEKLKTHMLSTQAAALRGEATLRREAEALAAAFGSVSSAGGVTTTTVRLVSGAETAAGVCDGSSGSLPAEVVEAARKELRFATNCTAQGGAVRAVLHEATTLETSFGDRAAVWRVATQWTGRDGCGGESAVVTKTLEVRVAAPRFRHVPADVVVDAGGASGADLRAKQLPGGAARAERLEMCGQAVSVTHRDGPHTPVAAAKGYAACWAVERTWVVYVDASGPDDDEVAHTLNQTRVQRLTLCSRQPAEAVWLNVDPAQQDSRTVDGAAASSAGAALEAGRKEGGMQRAEASGSGYTKPGSVYQMLQAGGGDAGGVHFLNEQSGCFLGWHTVPQARCAPAKQLADTTFADEPGHTGATGGVTAERCAAVCCGSPGCGGWEHTQAATANESLASSGMCREGQPCCWLKGGQAAGSRRAPKVGRTAGLVRKLEMRVAALLTCTEEPHAWAVDVVAEEGWGSSAGGKKLVSLRPKGFHIAASGKAAADVRFRLHSGSTSAAGGGGAAGKTWEPAMPAGTLAVEEAAARATPDAATLPISLFELEQVTDTRAAAKEKSAAVLHILVAVAVCSVLVAVAAAVLLCCFTRRRAAAAGEKLVEP